MALTLPTADDLDKFSHDLTEDIDEEWKDQALEQARALFFIATGITEDPSEETVAQIVKWGLLDMAWSLLIQTDNKEETYSPHQSERIGSYSYSKASSQIRAGAATGIAWFDSAVKLVMGSTTAGSIWSVTEHVFEQPFSTGPKLSDQPDFFGGDEMSYRTMMRHRITVLRLVETQQNGYSVHSWRTVATGVRAFVDLNFIRRGKDPIWTPEAGRPGDRTGVLFLLPAADVRSGDRIKVTKGPSGTFEIEQAVDEAWRPTEKHHLEIGIIEVARSLTGQEP